MRTVLYSAVFGGYDVVPPLPLTPGVDRVMFTDDPTLDAPGWDLVHMHSTWHPRMAAKQFKLLPHHFLPDHDRRVWMDGSHTLVTPEAIEGALRSINESGLALHKHPGRTDLYQEATASTQFEKYDGQPVELQAEAYRKEGHPEKWGLWAAGTIASDHCADGLFEDWWEEVMQWSYQDQISLPMVMWRAGQRPGEFPYPQTPSPWFTVGGHTRND